MKLERTGLQVARWRNKIAPAVLALCLLVPLQAEDEPPVVRAQVSDTVVYLGDTVTYSVKILNVRSSPQPDLSALEEDFEVALANERSLNSSQLMIINGREYRHEEVGHEYLYQLRPKKEGALDLPAPKVTVDGKEYLGNALRISVRGADKSDAASVEVLIAPERIYPSQPFKVTVRIALRALPGREDQSPLDLHGRLRVGRMALDIPWLQDLPKGVANVGDIDRTIAPLVARRGGFSLVVRGMLDRYLNIAPPHRTELRKNAEGKEEKYYLYDLVLPYVAEEPLQATLGPVALRGRFVTGTDGSAYLTRELNLLAPAQTLVVRDLRAENAPADFCGAIGKIELKAFAEPRALRVGDPLTLQLDIVSAGEGGSLGLIGPPDLEQHEQIAQDFAILDRRPVGEVVGDVKRFRYGLRPKKPGVHIPPVSVSYFDTQTEGFVQTHSQAVDLEVTEGERLSGAEVVSSGPRVSEGEELRRAEGGIHQNFTAFSNSGGTPDARWFAALPLALLAAYAALSLAVGRYRRLAQDSARQRRAAALKNARKRMAGLPAGAVAAAPLRAALLGLVADLCNLPEAGLTLRDAGAALAAARAPEEARSELKALVEALEGAAYGGLRPGDMAALRTRAESLAVRLSEAVKA